MARTKQTARKTAHRPNPGVARLPGKPAAASEEDNVRLPGKPRCAVKEPANGVKIPTHYPPGTVSAEDRDATRLRFGRRP